MTSPSRASRAAVVAATLLVVVAGCGEESESGSGTAPSGPETSSAPPLPDPDAPQTADAGVCPEVVPDAILGDLGWDPADGAVEGRGGCTWTGPEGTVTVFRSADEHVRACDLLQQAAPEGAFRDQVDAPGGDQTCGYVQPGDLGQSELAVELDAQTILVSVAAIEPTAPETVEDALLALTTTAGLVP